MKYENSKVVFQGAVLGEIDVTLSLEPGEAQRLQEALATVHQYEEAAISGMTKSKIDGVSYDDPRRSEWHMISYAIKNDKVIVSVRDGMIG